MTQRPNALDRLGNRSYTVYTLRRNTCVTSAAIPSKPCGLSCGATKASGTWSANTLHRPRPQPLAGPNTWVDQAKMQQNPA
jgi:hypothetical protein